MTNQQQAVLRFAGGKGPLVWSLLAWLSACVSLPTPPEERLCANGNLDAEAGHWVLAAEKAPAVFLLRAKDQRPFYVNHVKPEPAASAGLMLELKPGHHSLLAVDRKAFHLACFATEAKHGSLEPLDCKEVLSVCALKPEIVKAEEGVYWLIENVTAEELLTFTQSKRP